MPAKPVVADPLGTMYIDLCGLVLRVEIEDASGKTLVVNC